MILGIKRSFAIFPFIFIRKGSKIEQESDAVHEDVHRLQQFRWLLAGVTLGWALGGSFLWIPLGGVVGLASWFILYFVSGRFRWSQERVAWKRQIEFERAHGLKRNKKTLILILATQYWGMITWHEAMKFVNRVS